MMNIETAKKAVDAMSGYQLAMAVSYESVELWKWYGHEIKSPSDLDELWGMALKGLKEKYNLDNRTQIVNLGNGFYIVWDQGSIRCSPVYKHIAEDIYRIYA